MFSAVRRLYGLRVRKEGGAALEEKVMAALDLVKMSAFAKRNGSQLSGGQQQRVALARAFAFSPSVLLFDEPLSNLDAKLRAEMRIELRELQRRLGVTSLYVTHDLEEALAMSDRIVVMRTGKIEQIGTAADIYDRPRTAFVADFVGSANLVAGRPIERAASSERIAVDVGGARLQGVTLGRRGGDEVTLSLRTVHLRLLRLRTMAMSGPSRSASRCFLATSRRFMSFGAVANSSSASRSHIAMPRTNQPF
jgi:iron(III) transport system ATP-binding protein